VWVILFKDESPGRSTGKENEGCKERERNNGKSRKMNKYVKILHA
jgi:hypothetical protein